MTNVADRGVDIVKRTTKDGVDIVRRTTKVRSIIMNCDVSL